jgi:nicotinamide-nucleotide amidase
MAEEDVTAAGGRGTGADQAAGATLIVDVLTERGQTIAVAESLTGGLLAAALVAVPGASAVFRGGIVAYASDLKSALLGVPAALLERCGAVHADVAAAMAEGVRTRLNATFGIATTGVAGPDPADGQPVGTVHIAAAGTQGTARRKLALAGDRGAIRDQTVAASVMLLAGLLTGPDGTPGEETTRLQRYVKSEHTEKRSRRLSVRTGTVET